MATRRHALKESNENLKVWQTNAFALKGKHEETKARPEQEIHEMVGLFDMASPTEACTPGALPKYHDYMRWNGECLYRCERLVDVGVRGLRFSTLSIMLHLLAYQTETRLHVGRFVAHLSRSCPVLRRSMSDSTVVVVHKCVLRFDMPRTLYPIQSTHHCSNRATEMCKGAPG